MRSRTCKRPHAWPRSSPTCTRLCMATRPPTPETPIPDAARGLHRFFVDPALLDGERVALAGVQAHQISRVLRLKVGDRVVLVDGTGHEHRVQLNEVRSSAVTGIV